MNLRSWSLNKVWRFNNDPNSKNEGCAVLLYHRIFKPTIDAQLLSVTPENFEQHLIFLKENYEIISYPTLVQRLREKTIKKRSICLTFDDGYLDNYSEAFPLLKKYNVPATIFVCTANVGSNEEFWWDMLENVFLGRNEKYDNWNALSSYRDANLDRYLNLQECFKALNHIDRSILLKEISKSCHARENYRSMNFEELTSLHASDLIHLGAHTENHYSLGRMNLDTAIGEVRTCVGKLKEVLGEKHFPFSYPFGGSSDCRNDLDQAFKEEGIDAVFINQFGICQNHTNKLQIPRILVRNLQGEVFGSFVNNLWN